MLTPAEKESLRTFVGSATFTRGRAYARQGAVRRVRWTEDGACAFGEVQGGARSPYGGDGPRPAIDVGPHRGDRRRLHLPGRDQLQARRGPSPGRRAPDRPRQTRTPSSLPRARARPKPAPKGGRQERPAGRPPCRPWLMADDPGPVPPGPVWSRPTEIGLQFELVLTPPKTASLAVGVGDPGPTGTAQPQRQLGEDRHLVVRPRVLLFPAIGHRPRAPPI